MRVTCGPAERAIWRCVRSPVKKLFGSKGYKYNRNIEYIGVPASVLRAGGACAAQAHDMSKFSPVIGRIFGVDIELHWLSIAFLLLILIADPAHPYLFIIFVVVLVCILLHELGHSLTALRNNVAVKKIILILPIGGGSVIEPSALTPEKELRITAVGPSISLLLGLLFGIGATLAQPGMLRVSLQLLFEINILLGVLNFLPWFPLDGGRMLRSYLQRTRNFFDSTKTAVEASKGMSVAYVVGASAYIILFTKYSAAFKELGILINVVLAVFIYGGAQAEMQYAHIRNQIAGMRAGAIADRHCIVAHGDMSAERLYRLAVSRRSHLVLFREKGRVRVFVASLATTRAMLRSNATLRMSGTEIPSVSYSSQLYKALDIIRTDEASVLAVLKGRRIVGFLTQQHIESIAALKMVQAAAREAKTSYYK